MEEEIDPWRRRTLCHSIPLSNLKEAVVLKEEVRYSYLKNKQMSEPMQKQFTRKTEK